MNILNIFKAMLHDFLKILICLNVIVNATGDINKHLYCWKYKLHFLGQMSNFGHFKKMPQVAVQSVV